LVSDDFATQDLAKSAKDEFEILVSRHGVQFTDEQDILRRLHFGEWQISHHFQSESLRLCLPIATPPLQLLLIDIVVFVERCLVRDSNGLQLLIGRRRTRARFSQARRVGIGII
jgi:hypothetical protein